MSASCTTRAGGWGMSPGVFFVHSFQKEWTGKKINSVYCLLQNQMPLMGTVYF